MIEMMIPLLKAQSFIEDARKFDPKTDVNFWDFGWIRETEVGMPGLSINRWYFYVFPDLACDLTRPWLEVPLEFNNISRGKILINRTERYRNETIDYSFLKKYEDNCLFIGTMKEYNGFTSQYNLQIKKLHVNNFLEYAQAIQQCAFYISNQSQGFQLAEGIKHPRILEVCRYAPNVIVNGPDAYDFMSTALS